MNDLEPMPEGIQVYLREQIQRADGNVEKVAADLALGVVLLLKAACGARIYTVCRGHVLSAVQAKVRQENWGG